MQSVNNSNNNSVNKKEIVKKLLKQTIDSQNEDELIEMLIDKPISFDVDKEEDKNETRGDKLADKVAEVAGSWPFIIGFSGFLIGWIIVNVAFLANKAWDPYPFVLLNLLLSCLSALQAPIIMMSQNRQGKKDSLRNQNDYQIDLKSELILEDLHDNIKKVLSAQNKMVRYIDKENFRELEENERIVKLERQVARLQREKEELVNELNQIKQQKNKPKKTNKPKKK